MTRNAGPINPSLLRGQGGVKGDFDLRDDVAASSKASSPNVRDSQPSLRSRSRLNPLIAAVLAVVGGITFGIIPPIEYHCAATFQVVPSSPASQQADIEEALVIYSSHLGTTPTPSNSRELLWWTDAPFENVVRLGVTSTNPESGVKEAAAAAQGFLTALRERADEIRHTPTEAESVVADLISQMQERVVIAQAEVDSATASLPATDPRIDRDALIQRWQGLRSDFTLTRAKLADAAAGVDRLRSDFDTTRAIVSAEDRRIAMDNDAGLQQDLRELEVKLAELKLHLLDVWQVSSGRLDQLCIAANELSRVASQSNTSHSPQAVQGAVLGLATDSEAYQQTLAAFSEVWTSEFTNLQRMDVDPASGELLDRYQGIRTLLSDFLFSASQRLSAVRSHLGVLNEQTGDNARHHVLQSSLTRSFQAAQSAHHRFEFAAGGIDTPDNFRLDAALRSARGLRRRVLEQVHQIEHRLQGDAIELANKRRAAALAEAERAVEQTRATSEETITRLLGIQDGLVQAVGLSEGFLHAVLRAEVAANRVQIIREDLSLAQRRLGELVALREESSAEIGVELISHGLVGTSPNVELRVSLGGVGFVVTFLTILTGQWWVTGRRR